MEDIMYLLGLWPVLLILGAPMIIGVSLILSIKFIGGSSKAVHKTLTDKPKPEKERQGQYLDALQDFQGDEDDGDDDDDFTSYD